MRFTETVSMVGLLTHFFGPLFLMVGGTVMGIIAAFVINPNTSSGRFTLGGGDHIRITTPLGFLLGLTASVLFFGWMSTLGTLAVTTLAIGLKVCTAKLRKRQRRYHNTHSSFPFDLNMFNRKPDEVEAFASISHGGELYVGVHDLEEQQAELSGKEAQTADQLDKASCLKDSQIEGRATYSPDPASLSDSMLARQLDLEETEAAAQQGFHSTQVPVSD